jgi:sarcosine oxidase subunit gamma
MDEAVARPVEARSVAGVAAFRDRAAARQALATIFGVSLPERQGFVRAGAVVLSCLGAGRYLAAGPRGAGLPARLAGELKGVAAVTDQSDQWTAFALSGAGSTALLSSLVPIDLEDASFPVGALALTRAGHLDVRLWRLAEFDYEIAVSRSLAEELKNAVRA